MQRTCYKYLALFIFMAVISSVAHAEKGDNPTAPSAGEKSAVLTTSYFEGTWVGNWEIEGKTGRDITIAVGPKNLDGTFDIEYSWGSGSFRGSAIFPGTVKTKGREDGGKLEFEFNDPAFNRIMSMVMTKYEDVRAKALQTGGGGHAVAYLRRK